MTTTPVDTEGSLTHVAVWPSDTPAAVMPCDTQPPECITDVGDVRVRPRRVAGRLVAGSGGGLWSSAGRCR